MLFLTTSGWAALKDELLRLGNLAEYERQQRLLQSLRGAWADARAHVERLAVDQKLDLLHHYRIAHFDPAFRASDQALDRQQRGLEERWKNFLSDPGRITQVVKKHTIDIGYGKETIARELVQNIDDAYREALPPNGGPAWAEFRQQHGALVVSHAGRPFTADDVERICGLGGSGKDDQVQIGRFGLGFKSVLGVTREPIVLSHPYAFRINHVVVPERLEPEGEQCRRWHDWLRDHALTRFVLQSSSGQRAVDELVKRLVKEDDLAPRVLLFLNHLSEITLRAGNVERRVTREDRSAPDGLLPGFTRPTMFDDVQIRFRRLEMQEEGRAPSIEEFLLIEGRARVPIPIASMTKVKTLRCGVAFPWDPAEERIGPPLGGDSRLYLFLPTKTRTGLPFLVHGEFLTNLGRTDIDGENETNAGLAHALAALVRSTLQAAFARWRDDPDGLRAVTRVAPWLGDVLQEAAWLRPIRGVFATLIKADEPVVLTADGTLARPSECVLGQRLAQTAWAPLRAADPSCPLNPLVDPEIVIEVSRSAGGAIRTLTGPELVKSLFPNGLKLAKALLRIRTILRILYEQQSDDLTQWTETGHALAQLSRVPCMPEERGGVNCPANLDHPDGPSANASMGRRADLAAVVENDAAFRRWVIDNLRWAPPRTVPENEVTEPDQGEILVTPEDRKRMWAHNLRLIAAWWSRLGSQVQQDVTNVYSLTGDDLWPILGLSNYPQAQRADRLREALREGGLDHERVWFRLLCLANVAQSGRRYEEGVKFLLKFDHEFGGFDRLWLAPVGIEAGDVVGDLIRGAVDSYIKDRSAVEQASFWRRLYDFVKIRTLLRERQFLDGFWDTADEHPEFLAKYLWRGQVPGDRFGHRGLGESLSSQAFFLCRECYRLRIIRGDGARENCYAPNRHLTRFVRQVYGPDAGEWPGFEDYEGLSHQLHVDVTKYTHTRDFDDAFDIPLFHLAIHDEPPRLVTGLLMRDDVDGVRAFLNSPG